MNVVSSTLSSFSRTPTPVSKSRATDEGVSNPAGYVTDISSPGDAGEDDSDTAFMYREATDLPRELKLRCQIHLEERTYVAAITLLNGVLCDGISHAHGSIRPALMPPPSHLAVLATIAIQPTHTSKISEADVHDVASLSLSYLRNILATVGPVNGKLRDAFLFRSEPSRRRRRSSPDTENSDREDDFVDGKTANRDSLWMRGQDFWNVLGWVFNCAALYPHRWRWWKPWLEFMLDVLEADYEERMRLDEASPSQDGKCEYRMVQESLLVSYMMPKSSRSSPLKPIMSALFADGSAASEAIFKEVFKNEVKVASKSVNSRKRKKVDLEKDEFGDYDDHSSSGGSEPPTPEHQRTTDRMTDTFVPWLTSSLTDTIIFRQRLFALMSRAASDVPRRCNITLSELYGGFADKIAHLPAPVLSRFIPSHTSPLEHSYTVALIHELLPFFLPSSTPNPHRVDPDAAERNAVSQRIMVKCYLPFAYKSIENNAKLSLLFETLYRILWRSGVMKWEEELQEAVERGVEARQKTMKNPRQSKTVKKNVRKEDPDAGAKDCLRASGSRLLALTKLLKLQSSDVEE